MKNHHFKLLMIILASLLSGCSLVHLVEGVATLPIAVADGVLGTRMYDTVNSGLNELERPGKKIDKQSVQLLRGKTVYLSNEVAYLDASGVSYVNVNKDEQIYKDKWFFQEEGVFCTSHNRCHNLRQKDNSILESHLEKPLPIANGDDINLVSKFKRQQKERDEKQAELERQKAQEKLAQEKAEYQQKLAEYKANVEQQRLAAIEERCMKTPSCRAKKEREEHIAAAHRAKEDKVREVTQRRSNEQACSRLYVGKTVKIPAKCGAIRAMFGCPPFQGEIIGLSKENGVATAKFTSDGYGQTIELSCAQF